MPGRRAPDEWLSQAAVAKLAGCSTYTVETYVAAGRIRTRPRHGGRPSIERISAEEFARWFRAQARARRRHAAALATQAAQTRAFNQPPDDHDVWLDTTTTALVLGCTASWVVQLAAADRLPVTRRGRRLWFRRGDIEHVAAAWAFARRQHSQAA